MQIFKKWGRCGATALIIVAILTLAGAKQNTALAASSMPDDPVAAFRKGVAAHKRGDGKNAAALFDFASGQGVLGAQLYLGRMYSQGDLVEKNDGLAFEHYSRMMRGFNHLRPNQALSKYIAEAYVAIGKYYENGLPERGIEKDLVKASRYYNRAASYYGNPIAQYRLGRLYLKEGGLTRNISVAAKWLHSAAKKNYAPAQAVLADILWAEGPFKRPVQALALIELAKNNATGAARGWITDMHNKLYEKAGQEDKQKAVVMVRRWREPNGREIELATVAPNTDVKLNLVPIHIDPLVMKLTMPEGYDQYDVEMLFGSVSSMEPSPLDGVSVGGFRNAGHRATE